MKYKSNITRVSVINLEHTVDGLVVGSHFSLCSSRVVCAIMCDIHMLQRCTANTVGLTCILCI